MGGGGLCPQNLPCLEVGCLPRWLLPLANLRLPPILLLRPLWTHYGANLGFKIMTKNSLSGYQGSPLFSLVLDMLWPIGVTAYMVTIGVGSYRRYDYGHRFLSAL